MSGKVNEREGTLDEFIDNLVSVPPQRAKSIHLELLDEGNDSQTIFNILIEIFTKVMKYMYGDRNGRVNLDEMGEAEVEKITKYFNSFGFEFFVEKIEGNNKNKVSFGKNEDKPIKSGDLKAQCLKLQTSNNLYIFYFDFLI